MLPSGPKIGGYKGYSDPTSPYPPALLSCSRCFKASKIQSAPYCTILETAKLKCCEGAKFQRHLIVESQLLLRISEITLCKLCCKCLRRCHFGLETRVICNFEFLNLGFGGFKKCIFFKSTNSQYFLTKISGIGSFVYRINWCKGHGCGSILMITLVSSPK